MGARRAMVAMTVAGTLALGAATAGAAEKEPTGPWQPDILTAALYSMAAPTIAPPGANDWNCRPSAAHPYPVVLVHGTFGNMTDSWQALSPLLANNGYCVFALDYGGPPGNQIQATGDIPTSAAQLGAFVDRVLQATGATKVDVVGHSQGGMMPRWYIKFLGGGGAVDDLVGLVPSNHGTTNPLAPPAGQLGCPACAEQAAGSTFLQTLNAGDETPGQVSYTVVTTRYDEVVVPYTSAFLAPGPLTVNLVVQDYCPADPVEHNGMSYDPVVAQFVEDALGHPGPANPAFHPTC